MLIESTSLSDDYILDKIISVNKKQTEEDINSNNDRVFIVPTLQMNVVDYREDETFLLDLLSHYASLPPSPEKDSVLTRIRLATGYLNLQKDYLEVLNGKAN